MNLDYRVKTPGYHLSLPNGKHPISSAKLKLFYEDYFISIREILQILPFKILMASLLNLNPNSFCM